MTTATPTLMSASNSTPAPLASHQLAAWRGLLQVHAQATQRLDAQMQAEHGLSISSYEVLMFLGDAPDQRMRMSEIAERVLLSRSGCTRLVDRLVDQGCVTRSAASTDGRGLYAQLTSAGLDKLTAARATHHEGIRRFFLDHLTSTDQLVLADICSRFDPERLDDASPSGTAHLRDAS